MTLKRPFTSGIANKANDEGPHVTTLYTPQCKTDDSADSLPLLRQQRPKSQRIPTTLYCRHGIGPRRPWALARGSLRLWRGEDRTGPRLGGGGHTAPTCNGGSLQSETLCASNTPHRCETSGGGAAASWPPYGSGDVPAFSTCSLDSAALPATSGSIRIAYVAVALWQCMTDESRLTH